MLILTCACFFIISDGWIGARPGRGGQGAPRVGSPMRGGVAVSGQGLQPPGRQGICRVGSLRKLLILTDFLFNSSISKNIKNININQKKTSMLNPKSDIEDKFIRKHSTCAQKWKQQWALFGTVREFRKKKDLHNWNCYIK